MPCCREKTDCRVASACTRLIDPTGERETLSVVDDAGVGKSLCTWCAATGVVVCVCEVSGEKQWSVVCA